MEAEVGVSFSIASPREVFQQFGCTKNEERFERLLEFETFLRRGDLIEEIPTLIC